MTGQLLRRYHSCNPWGSVPNPLIGDKWRCDECRRVWACAGNGWHLSLWSHFRPLRKVPT